MDENLSEKEQIEQIAKWWDENKTYVITGLVLGASVLFGWNYYKNQKLTRAYGAAELHTSLVRAADSGNLDAATAAAGQLAGEFGATPYASLAPLAMARLYVDKGDLDAAAQALVPALNAPDEVGKIARLRLARVRLAQEQPDEALKLVGGQAGEYAAMYAEVRGDAHAALGNVEQARQAYDEALDSDGSQIDRNFVQMKLDALGVGVASVP